MEREGDLTKLAQYLFEVSTLRNLPRIHKQTLLVEDSSDTIAAHELLATKIGWFLAKAEGADPYKVLLMCLTHDDSETRSGDQNWVHKRYVKVFEEEIIKDQTEGIPYGNQLRDLMQEYNQRETLEAQVAKDADLLAQVLLLKEYEWGGNQEAERWLVGKEQGKRLSTDTARELVKEIVKQRPSEWWDNLWTADRR